VIPLSQLAMLKAAAKEALLTSSRCQSC